MKRKFKGRENRMGGSAGRKADAIVKLWRERDLVLRARTRSTGWAPLPQSVKGQP